MIMHQLFAPPGVTGELHKIKKHITFMAKKQYIGMALQIYITIMSYKFFQCHCLFLRDTIIRQIS